MIKKITPFGSFLILSSHRQILPAKKNTIAIKQLRDPVPNKIGSNVTAHIIGRIFAPISCSIDAESHKRTIRKTNHIAVSLEFPIFNEMKLVDP